MYNITKSNNNNKKMQQEKIITVYQCITTTNTLLVYSNNKINNSSNNNINNNNNIKRHVWVKTVIPWKLGKHINHIINCINSKSEKKYLENVDHDTVAGDQEFKDNGRFKKACCHFASREYHRGMKM